MRNEALNQVADLVGEWKLTMTDAWFLESPEIKGEGSATIQWLGEAFLEMRATLGQEHSSWHWLIGRSDAREQVVMLYHDERGVLRVFDMTFGGGQWTLVREDPDFSASSRPSGETESMVGGRHRRMPASPGARTST